MRFLTFSLLLIFALAGFTACDSDSTESVPAEESAEVVVDDAAEAQEEPAEIEPEIQGQELAEDMEPGESRHFGAPFTIEDEPVDLAEVLAKAGEDQDFKSDEPVKISANVHQVCQSKGCWFTLSTDAVEIPVRVRMKDYGFFVARNTTGAPAIVEGTLARTTISEEMAQHYADDLAKNSGKEPEQVEGDQDSFEFTATAIAITLPES